MKDRPIIIPCPTASDWHRERSSPQYIGASEAAALINPATFGSGSRPYMTKRQLWKRLKGEPEKVEETEPMRAGLYAEETIARWYADETNRVVVRPQDFYGSHESTPESFREPCRKAFAIIIRHPTLPFQCTPDKILLRSDSSGNAQLKNVSEWKADEWESGEPGETTPPLIFQVQVQVELACMGMEWGALIGLLGGNRLRHRDQLANARFIEGLGAQAADLIASDSPPEAQPNDLRSLIEEFNQHIEGKVAEVSDPVPFMEYALLGARIKLLEEAREAYKATILAKMGDAEAAVYNGEQLCTYKTSERNEAAREARKTTVRTLRIASKITKEAKTAAEKSL